MVQIVVPLLCIGLIVLSCFFMCLPWGICRRCTHPPCFGMYMQGAFICTKQIVHFSIFSFVFVSLSHFQGVEGFFYISVFYATLYIWTIDIGATRHLRDFWIDIYKLRLMTISGH